MVYVVQQSPAERERQERRWRAQARERKAKRFLSTLSSAAIGGLAYLGFLVVSMVLPATPVSSAILLGLLACFIAPTVVWVYKRFTTHGARSLILPLVMFGGSLLLSFFVPGAHVAIAGTLVVAACIPLLYTLVSSLFRLRVVAVLFTLVPFVGAYFYVPKALARASLVPRLAAPALAAESAALLSALEEAASVVGSSSAVVTYRIAGNRLFADIARDGAVNTLPVDVSSLVATRVPWLEYDLERRLSSLMAPGAKEASPEISDVLAPVVASLEGCQSVLVAAGDLQAFPHQTVLHGKRVFRSGSLNADIVTRNLRGWTSLRLEPDDVVVLNALPQSASQLAGLEIEQSWDAWQGVHGAFTEALPATVEAASQTATRDSTLRALREESGVIFVVAHCDGASIRLPNGEALEVSDLESVADEIRANGPTVFLFSCETARAADVGSFAEALLRHGASTVIAPVTQISTSEALDVFRLFLQKAFVEPGNTTSEAFEQTLEQTGRKLMEIWIGQVIEPTPSGLQRRVG